MFAIPDFDRKTKEFYTGIGADIGDLDNLVNTVFRVVLEEIETRNAQLKKDIINHVNRKLKMANKMTWRRALEGKFELTGDSIDDIIDICWGTREDYDEETGEFIDIRPDTIEELDRPFDGGYGGTNGTPFIAWTPTFIYFCVQYDGLEWVSYLPRNPTPEYESGHHGGG